MTQVDISKIADSSFVPGFAQDTDHSDLGTFIVAKLKVTGELNMKLDSDFKEVDGGVSYAVLPESWIGTSTSTRAFMMDFSFDYSNFISFTCSAPNDKFTEAEESEVISILASFQVSDSKVSQWTEQEDMKKAAIEESLADFAGTYTPYEFVHDFYGGGSQWQDIVLDKNGIITGGGTDWNPNISNGAKPISITKEEKGIIVIKISDNEEYMIYPIGVAPEGAGRTHHYNNVVNIRHFIMDGGVMDILYYDKDWMIE